MSSVFGSKPKSTKSLSNQLDVDGKTCDRCAGTGDEIHHFINRLHEECSVKDVHITLKEINLTEKEVEESNRL